MDETKIPKAVIIVLSIAAGTASAIIVFFLCILFAFALGLFWWSDGGDNEFLRRLETTTNISVVVSAILALLTGIFVISKMNQPNQKNHEKNVSG